MTSTGFLLQPHLITDDGAGLQGRQQNCTRLPPDTGQTTRPRESTSLHYIIGLASYRHRWEQTKVTQRSRDSSLYWRLSNGTKSGPMSGQQSHSPSSTKDTWLICSDFTSTPHSITPFQPTNFFFSPLSMVICCGFFLVTNGLILSCFGQKHLLKALNVDVNITSSMHSGSHSPRGNHPHNDLIGDKHPLHLLQHLLLHSETNTEFHTFSLYQRGRVIMWVSLCLGVSHMLDDARLVSSCLSRPSRASPLLSLLWASRGYRV